MKRATVQRSQNGILPIQYVIVLTKVDKASAKALTSTRQAIMNIYQTISTINANSIVSATNDDNVANRNNDDSNDTSSYNNIETNYKKMKKNNKDMSNSNHNSGLTIIETSSTEKVGRELLWQIILKLLEDRSKLLMAT